MKLIIRVSCIFIFVGIFFIDKAFAQTGWKKLENPGIVPGISENFISALANSYDGRIVYAGIDSGLIKFDGYAWQRMGDINAPNAAKRVTCIATNAAGDIFIAGYFTNAASHYYVAKWNGSSWVELGTLNPNGVIYTIACDNSGNVYAGGNFTNAGGFRYVAKWNGTSWTEIGSLQANNEIRTICTDASGNVYAGGVFTNAGGFRYVAKWTGTSWAETGPGLLNANNTIMNLATDANGHVYASGAFTNASSKKYVAKWDGASWAELGAGANALNGNGYLYTMKVDPQGNVYVAGSIFNTAGKYYVSKWNGTNWTEVSGIDSLNANNIINCVTTDIGGKVYSAGSFFNVDNLKYIAVFDPVINKWDTAGNIVMPNLGIRMDIQRFVINKQGHVFINGCFSSNGAHRSGIKEWNGIAWTDVGTSYPLFYTSGCVYSLNIDSTLNNIYVTGAFLNTVDSTSIAKWDGTSWKLIATTSLSNGTIGGVPIDKYGNLYAGGTRQSDGHRFARKWDGTSWTELGDGTTNLPENFYLFMDHHGHLYVYGYDNNQFTPTLLKWDGTTWITIPNNFSIFTYPIFNIMFDYNDNIYIGHGDAGQVHVWKYDGTSWTTVGDPNYFSIDQYDIFLTCDKYNNIYATGSSLLAYNAVHKWDGVSWKPVGPSSINWDLPADDVFGITFDDATGTLYAYGDLSYNAPAQFISYYSGLAELCPSAASTNLESDITGNAYQWQLNSGNGFNNITNNSFYSGTNTQSLHINNIPSSAHNYEYRCLVDGSASFIFKLKFTDTWLANSGTAWENPANWSCGTVPDANTDVFFYGGHAIVNTGTTVGTLSANGSNTSIQVNPGVTLTITH